MGTSSMINNSIDNGGVKGVKYPWHHLCIVLFPLRIFVFWRGGNDMIKPPPICYFLFTSITPLGVIYKIQIFRNIWVSMDFLVICFGYFGTLVPRKSSFSGLVFFWFDFCSDFGLILIWFFEFSLVLIFPGKWWMPWQITGPRKTPLALIPWRNS